MFQGGFAPLVMGLDITINKAGHAFRSCHVTTSNNNVHPKAEQLQQCFAS